jgi:hypothetical protein
LNFEFSTRKINCGDEKRAKREENAPKLRLMRKSSGKKIFPARNRLSFTSSSARLVIVVNYWNIDEARAREREKSIETIPNARKEDSRAQFNIFKRRTVNDTERVGGRGIAASTRE